MASLLITSNNHTQLLALGFMVHACVGSIWLINWRHVYCHSLATGSHWQPV